MGTGVISKENSIRNAHRNQYFGSGAQIRKPTVRGNFGRTAVLAPPPTGMECRYRESADWGSFLWLADGDKDHPAGPAYFTARKGIALHVRRLLRRVTPAPLFFVPPPNPGGPEFVAEIPRDSRWTGSKFRVRDCIRDVGQGAGTRDVADRPPTSFRVFPVFPVWCNCTARMMASLPLRLGRLPCGYRFPNNIAIVTAGSSWGGLRRGRSCPDVCELWRDDFRITSDRTA